jgi:hypothetical protein
LETAQIAPVTPAMAAGLSKRFLAIENIVSLADGKKTETSISE